MVKLDIELLTRAAEQALKRLDGILDRVDDKLDNIGKNSGLPRIPRQSERAAASLEKLRNTGALAFAAIATGIGLATKEFAEFETALVGVAKTTNITGASLEAFGDEIQNLSRTIPVADEELASIAQVAGQLGVRGSANLLKFVDTVAKLGVSTDLAGEEAALVLTRILNITGEGVNNIDKFGSVIVALGNNFAATESEIARTTNEIARSTAFFGVSSGEAAALGTALKAMGSRAEGAGTGIGRTFLKIQDAINGGGKELRDFTRIMNVSAEQLEKDFGEDATKVFEDFIIALNRIPKTEVTGELAKFGLATDETRKVLLPLIDNVGIFSNALRVQAREMENATALNNEAERAFDTLASRFQLTANNLSVLAEDIIEQMIPAFEATLEIVNDIINFFNELDEDTKKLIGSVVVGTGVAFGFAAALSAMAIAATAVTFAFGPVAAIIAVLSAAAGVATAAFVGFREEQVKAIQTNDLQGRSVSDLANELSMYQRQLNEIKKEEKAELAVSTRQVGERERNIASINVNTAAIKGNIIAIQEQIKFQKAADGIALSEKQRIEEINKELQEKEKLRRTELDTLTELQPANVSQLSNSERSIALLKAERAELQQNVNAREKLIASAKAQEETNSELLFQQNLFRELEIQNVTEHNAILLQNELDKIDQEASIRRLAIQQTFKDTKEGKDALLKLDITTAKKRAEAAKNVDKLEEKRRQTNLSDQASFFSNVAVLAQSQNKAIAGIAKAAGLLQIAIRTPAAVASSIAFGTELGGPSTGALFGLITKAAMAAQAAQLAGLSFQDGGIVPGNSFSGDNVAARVNSGEMILNRQQQSNLFELANGGAGQNQQTAPQETVVNVEIDGEAIARAVSKQVADGFEIGEVV